MDTNQSIKAHHFSFAPRIISDVTQIQKIIDSIPIAGPSDKGGQFRFCFHDKNSDRRSEYSLTSVGREFLKYYAKTIVEVPFVCIAHKFHYKSEYRDVSEKTVPLDDVKYYPPEECRRAKFADVWDDEKFFSLLEDKNGEVSSTCKVSKCPECDGVGKIKEWFTRDVKEWTKCPVCDGEGHVGIHVCRRCDGDGKVIVHRSTKDYSLERCRKCNGAGKIKTVLMAEHKNEEGDHGWTHTCVVQDPPVVPYWSFDRLSGPVFKGMKERGLLTLFYKKSSVEGVVNPNTDFDDFEILDGKKRVIDACFNSESVSTSGVNKYSGKVIERRFSSSGFKMQNDSAKGVRNVCSDEHINIYTGVCAYCIEMPEWGLRMWINAASGGFYGTPKGEAKQSYTGHVSDKGAFSLQFWGADSGAGWLQMSQFSDNKEMTAALKKILKASRNVEPHVRENRISESGQESKQREPAKGKTTTKATTVRSAKKRWKFVLLGVLFGWFGAHYMYVKRWLMLLLTLGSFATGVVMMNKSESNQKELPVQTEQQTEGDASKGNSEAIGAVCLVLWLVMWLGGALFVKKDGKGNRM